MFHVSELPPPLALPPPPAESKWPAWVKPVALLLALVGLALLWRYTALSDVVRLNQLLARAEALRAAPASALVVPLVFVVLAVLLVPVTLLRWTAVIAFGPVLGTIYASVGGALAALIGHEVGRRAGAESIERLSHGRVHRVRARMEGRGVLAVAAVRLLPLGPFTIINAVLGALGIPRRDFILGTVLVMVPTLILMALAVSAFPVLKDWLFS
jgi:phospholipase D1/2